MTKKRTTVYLLESTCNQLNDLAMHGKQNGFHRSASCVLEHLIKSYHEAYADEIKAMYELKASSMKYTE